MLICRDLGALYSEALGTGAAALPAPGWRYDEYVRWHRSRHRGRGGDEDRAFWTERLSGLHYPQLRSPVDRGDSRRPASANVHFVIDQQRADGLRALARTERATLHMVMLALYVATLHSASADPDIAIGSVFANRPRPEVHETAGFFANMVVLRTVLGDAPTMRDVIGAVRTTVLETLRHQNMPYADILRDPRLYNVWEAAETVFHMLAVPPGVTPPSGVGFAGVAAEPMPIPDGMGSRFDLELLVVPQVDRLEGVYRYAADRYEADLVRLLAERYVELVDLTLADPGRPIVAEPA